MKETHEDFVKRVAVCKANTLDDLKKALHLADEYCDEMKGRFGEVDAKLTVVLIQNAIDVLERKEEGV